MPQMDEETVGYRQDRSVSKAHFEARTVRYRNLLKEKWWVLVVGTLVGLGVAAAIYKYRPLSYVSVGRMIVSIKLAIPEGSVYTEELSNFLGTQAELMRSSEVIRRAHTRAMAQRPDQVFSPVELRVTVSPKTTIFVLQAKGNDPGYTQTFLQACMEEYSALKRDMRTETSDTTLKGLTEEVLRLQNELANADDQLAEFQKTNSVVLFEEQGNSTGTYLTALTQRLAGLKSEYELLQLLTLDQSLQRQQGSGETLHLANDAIARASTTGGERTDPDYLKAKQQVLLLKAEQEELGQYLRPKHPKMIAMSEEIGRREGLLKIFRDQSAEQLESKKAALALQIQNLEKDVKTWNGKALDIQGKTAEYQRLKANSQRIQALYDRLLATMQTLDVNKGISPESVTIHERATVGLPDKVALPKALAIGGVVGLVLSVLLLWVLDRLDDRLNSFTELQELFEEDVVGQIPRERSGRRGTQLALLQPEDERHALVEAYRNLRSSLLYMTEAGQQRPRILLVTSSVPNDGKSFTTSNLAITMANTGSRVLLVDADLRKGALHSRFGVAEAPGLSEVLKDGSNWETAVHAAGIKNLFLLPRGAFAHNSSELFLSEATPAFLKQAAAKYDYVLLDSVPVMAADDVTSIAPLVDGVLFVIRANYTSARVAHAALESLYQRQVRVLGLIFNAVPPRSIDYYYYKYRDYYRAYYAAPPPGKGKKQQKAASQEPRGA